MNRSPERSGLGRVAAQLVMVALLAAIGSSCATNRQPGASATPPDAGANSRIADAVAPSLVRVEYTLRYDKGDAPYAAASGGRMEGWNGEYSGGDCEESVKQERPMEIGGVLIAPDLVISADPVIDPRFVKSIAVRAAGRVVEATPAAYAIGQSAVLLHLSRPITGSAAADAPATMPTTAPTTAPGDAAVGTVPTPVTFDDQRARPYYAVTFNSDNGEWVIHVRPLGAGVVSTLEHRRFLSVDGHCLIVDKHGQAVGMSMNGELPLDDSWKGSPTQWPSYTAAQMQQMLARTRAQVDQTLLGVTLNFRSPKARDPEMGMVERYMSSSDESQQSATEHHAVGVVLDGGQRILVLDSLRPQDTARLERITVRTSDAKDVAATFECTLQDYGALVARLEHPLPQSAILTSIHDIRTLRHRLLPSAEVLMEGDQRIVRVSHRRITSFSQGWRRNLYPGISGSDRVFLFDADGALTVLPIERRTKVAVRERWDPQTGPQLTGLMQLEPVLADPTRFADASNIPLSEQEADRLAWLGVELQPLTPELARVNKVADLSRDGQTGALVTYVYPDSPAAEAGIEPGYILLRVHAADQPKPLDVNAGGSEFGFGGSFPWDRYDELPEQYFDQVPRPWPSVDNPLNRMLTDLGFGTHYQAELFNNGKLIMKDLVVVQSPDHFDAAPRFKSEALGLTVRDMTYEVRRYFQRTTDDPGVIISKVEAGSKASVAGIKPFEFITHVNDQPVANVGDFQRLIAGQQELRLSVKRMARGRLVKLRLPEAQSPGASPTSRPSSDVDAPANADTAEPGALPVNAGVAPPAPAPTTDPTQSP